MTGAHFIYVIFAFIIFSAMRYKQDIVSICIIGTFVLGLYFTRNPVLAISVVFTSFIIVFEDFLPIIILIAIMIALSKTLHESYVSHYMMQPLAKFMKTPAQAFFVIGIWIMMLSWVFLPSPAIVLVGSIFLSLGAKAGLPPMGVAMALNLFAHGIAFSSDIIIQAVPSITAHSADITVNELIYQGIILNIVMAVTTAGVAFYRLKKDIDIGVFDDTMEIHIDEQPIIFSDKTITVAWLSTVVLIADIVLIISLALTSLQAKELIGGSVILLIIVANVILHGKDASNKINKYVVSGFVFAMKMFAMVVPVVSFFYMGDAHHLEQVFGISSAVNFENILMDVGVFISNTIPFTHIVGACVQTILGAISGLDGIGLSGLPLIGSLAEVFGEATGGNVAVFATLGQIASVWVGGGCLMPWALVSASSIAGISPTQLAHRNIVPVVSGLIVTTVVAIFIL
ncbi:MAG: hypothetical protein ATN35_10365 [Epulopiscium sp. Nele67-Bin004]|nr:MAG: hypothetical protein ATN35_10365 [Epulopiscium sp. Nele67-Bin004]